MSLSIPLAQIHNVITKESNPLIGSLVCHVVAKPISLADQPLVDHVLGSMAFNLGDADRIRVLGLDKVVVELP